MTQFCDARNRLSGFTVLCPSRYPRDSDSDVATSGSVTRAPHFYWASFNDWSGFPKGDGGHVIFGGQLNAFSLSGARGSVWSPKGAGAPINELPIPHLITTPMAGGGTYVVQEPPHVLEAARVAGHPALVLQAPAYPQGGLSGDHVIVVWNVDRHGYFVSLHFAVDPHGKPYSLSERLDALLVIAGSCSAVP